MLARMSTDVIVLGGGPAGLQAALTVARVGRSVTVLDSGEYRNAVAPAMHNYAGADGVPPHEHRQRARRDLGAYPTVTLLDRAATSVTADGADFVVEAGEPLRAASVVLATGVRDELPDVPGLVDLWGTGVAHCPFCHGYELRGRTVAVLGSSPQVRHVALLMGPLADRVVVLANGEPLEGELADDLTTRGVEVVPDPVSWVGRAGNGVRVAFAAGRTIEVGGVFVSPRTVQRAPFAAQLGLTLLPSGGVEVDDLQRTSVDGVLAAGDMAHRAALPMPMAAVVAAAAAGQVAGAAAVAALLGR
jgi:thioredoxin reductase